MPRADNQAHYRVRPTAAPTGRSLNRNYPRLSVVRSGRVRRGGDGDQLSTALLRLVRSPDGWQGCLKMPEFCDRFINLLEPPLQKSDLIGTLLRCQRIFMVARRRLQQLTDLRYGESKASERAY